MQPTDPLLPLALPRRKLSASTALSARHSLAALPYINALTWVTRSPLRPQATRFCAVGLLGFALNLTLYSLARNLLGAPPSLAAIVAFSLAVVNNHFLNRVWTFQERSAGYLGQGARFLAVSLIALAINLAVLQLLLSVGVGWLAAQSVAIIAATPTAFLFNRSWTFGVGA